MNDTLTLSIHVNVRRRSQQNGTETYGYIVETSTDGAGWATQYFIPLQVGETMADAKTRAENLARVFMNGCRYAGAAVRATSEGYAL